MYTLAVELLNCYNELNLGTGRLVSIIITITFTNFQKIYVINFIDCSLVKEFCHACI